MPTPTTMADLSTTAASNSPASTDTIASGDDVIRAIGAILRTTNAKGSDIASATTTDIGAATGEFVDVTGTTTITGLGTVAAGIVRTVRFTGALTLTHNATSLILPGGANITTANGDCAQFRSLGSGNWVCVGYIPAAGYVTATSTTTLTNKTLSSPVLTGSVTSSGNPSLNIGTGALTAGTANFNGSTAGTPIQLKQTSNASNKGFSIERASGTARGGIWVAADPALVVSLDNDGSGNFATEVGRFSTTGLAVTGEISATAGAKLNSTLNFYNSTALSISRGSIYGDGTGLYLDTSGSNIDINVNTTLRGRFSSTGLAVTGKIYVGTTSQTRRLTVDETDDSGAEVAYFTHSAATNTNQYGQVIRLVGDPNSVGNYFLACLGNVTQRAVIRGNGGIANYQANDVNLSDRREKTDFAPAKDYLPVINAIPVQTFNYIDQAESDPGLTLGVVAQDVQAVAPEMVMESNWGTAEDPKMRLSIYQTDLQYALMKCIQELSAKNDALEARLAALEAQ